MKGWSRTQLYLFFLFDRQVYFLAWRSAGPFLLQQPFCHGCRCRYWCLYMTENQMKRSCSSILSSFLSFALTLDLWRFEQVPREIRTLRVVNICWKTSRAKYQRVLGLSPTLLVLKNLALERPNCPCSCKIHITRSQGAFGVQSVPFVVLIILGSFPPFLVFEVYTYTG